MDAQRHEDARERDGRGTLGLLLDVTTLVALGTAIAVLGAVMGVAFVLWVIQTFM